MKNDELLALIEREEADCIAHFTSLLSEQRRRAMQYYYGQPYGNEIEGRSQVVTTEVKDAVEGILPALMAIFTAGDEIVRFEAQNPDDEAAAQQATDYANYVFSRLNNGFLALYCLIKDALLQKNGYVKVYWEKNETLKRESYVGLNELEFLALKSDPELELVSEKSYPDPDQPAVAPEMAAHLEQMGQTIPTVLLYDAAFKRTRAKGRICIDALPPEEVLISREAPNDITKARFVEHRTLKSLSEIRELGFNVEDDIADYAPNADFNLERVQRLSYDDALAYRLDETLPDPAMRRVWLAEAYTRVDFDGDGIAELRKVTKIGRTILDNVEFDSLPVIGGPAILMPHKHYGLSIYDLVGDLQLIKSTVMRQLLDNAYVANNGRMEVLDGMVNMADLLTARPNGVVRVKALGSVRRIENPLLGAPFYNLLEYLDKIKQNRVGATDFPNAVDPDAINAKATFVDAFKNAALERIGLMARLLAEGPIKAIFWKIIELESKYNDREKVVRLRDKWVKVDPREWADRFDMTVTVGLGTGNQQTTLTGAMGILNVQGGMLKAGLMGRVVTEKNMYEAARRYARTVFPKEADAFFNDPAQLPPPQPQPDADIMDIQLKAHKAEVQAHQREQKMQMDFVMSERDRAFEAQMAKFEASVGNLQAERERQSQLQMHYLERDQENRRMLIELLQNMKREHEQKIHDAAMGAMQHTEDQKAIVLQGVVESLIANQEHQQKITEDLIRVHTGATNSRKKS